MEVNETTPKVNIPVYDGSTQRNPSEANEEAYKKLLAESEKIHAILNDSQIVEDGQGLEEIPEHVDEMGDSIAAQVDFEGKRHSAEEPHYEETVSETSHESQEPLDDVEKQFNDNANHYENQYRESYLKEIEQERPYLLQRQQQLEAEVAELRQKQIAQEERELDAYEARIMEGLNDAISLGETGKHAILIRELAKIDRLREDKKNFNQMATQQYTPAYNTPAYNTQHQVYAPAANPQPMQTPYYGYTGQPPVYPNMYQQPIQPYMQQPVQQPVQQQAYQHPLTTQMPSKPSSAPSTAAPNSSRARAPQKSSVASKIHPFARELMKNHTNRPPGMKDEQYMDLYLEVNKNIKDK